MPHIQTTHILFHSILPLFSFYHSIFSLSHSPPHLHHSPLAPILFPIFSTIFLNNYFIQTIIQSHDFSCTFFCLFFFQASAKALSRKKGKKGGKRRRNKGNIKERKKSKPAEGKKKGNWIEENSVRRKEKQNGGKIEWIWFLWWVHDPIKYSTTQHYGRSKPYSNHIYLYSYLDSTFYMMSFQMRPRISISGLSIRMSVRPSGRLSVRNDK